MFPTEKGDPMIHSETGDPMKQWHITGGSRDITGLVLADVPRPEPGADQVRVRVRATSLNARDQIVLNGTYGQGVDEDLVPLSDGAGEIDAIGPGVTRWAVGDRVAGLYFGGWYDGPPPAGMGFGLGSPGQQGVLAESVVLHQDRVSRIPADLSFEEAATLPCAALTAWSALYGDRPIGPGSKVLVIGTGGVSMLALQLARAVGAEVIATSSSDEKLGKARALGAADTVNYSATPEWGEEVLSRTGGVDKIVNAVGGETLSHCVTAIGGDGEIAVMGLFAEPEVPVNLPVLMSKGASIRGTSVGGSKAFEDMVAEIEGKKIRPHVERVFDFTDAVDAYQTQARGVFGKVVIRGAL